VDGKLRFRILTPSREVWSGDVDAVTVTAVDGAIGVLPGHAPLLAQLKPGEASTRAGTEEHWFALGEGVVEVADDRVTALVRSGERADEIDLARAEQRRLEREKELQDKEISERAYRHAEASLEKQVVRIRVAGRR
jgi:F-type H+-transporting ATPase subunit epsilon